MKKLVIGILAHVDAGKTTLSESILYKCGTISKKGRVDHKDTFLDNFELEKNRGITIFSKQAVFNLDNTQIFLLDTPGHVDFSSEMERTLQVLDYAILVISAADKVQGHTQTLWNLLKLYKIPTFIFINKMDQPDTSSIEIMEELKLKLSENCINFSIDKDNEQWKEDVAVCDDLLLEEYIENNTFNENKIPELITQRRLFPCYFGSALKSEGIDEFLEGISKLTKEPVRSDKFGARIFKITRDNKGIRLTHMKITGGSLKVRTELTNNTNDNEETWNEKADQIRIYSGDKFTPIQEASAGMICAVTGLSHTFAGEGIGEESLSEPPVLEPVLVYQICTPPEYDKHKTLQKLRIIEEEEPLLHISYNEDLDEISANVSGDIQLEILKSLVKERFNIPIEFESGSIIYKESIKTSSIGIGHFEPLRHYAEVHLLLEPLKPGSGLIFDTDCSEDLLNKNWQRLILTHLAEKEHRGVLIGAPITDIKITVIGGRAHQKHTEGGDFRQATYRAVRHGLRRAESIILEPFYEFTLEVPSEMVGRAMSDLQKMSASFDMPKLYKNNSILTGTVPVSTMTNYQKEVISYTRGKGRLSCALKGYYPCHNQEEVINSFNYDADLDTNNPCGSVFCTHGMGYYVDWDKVEDYMHVENKLLETMFSDTVKTKEEIKLEKLSYKERENIYTSAEQELQDIFERTYGPIRSRADEVNNTSKKYTKWKKDDISNTYNTNINKKNKTPEKEYMLVDGYNIIFSWNELNELSKINLDAARTKLMDIMCNYQAYKGFDLILVFDAYKVKGNQGSFEKYHNIFVVYTKEAITADQYIENTVHEMNHKYRVTVATSDNLEQIIILGQGASRMSARELEEDVINCSKSIAEHTKNISKTSSKNMLFDSLNEKDSKHIENLRLGKTNKI